jgi:hypothetical protein
MAVLGWRPPPGVGQTVSNAIEIRTATDLDAEALAGLLGELGYPVAAHEIPGRLERFTSSGAGRVFVAVKTGTLETSEGARVDGNGLIGRSTNSAFRGSRPLLPLATPSGSPPPLSAPPASN